MSGQRMECLADTTHVNRMTDRCKNITLTQLHCGRLKRIILELIEIFPKFVGDISQKLSNVAMAKNCISTHFCIYLFLTLGLEKRFHFIHFKVSRIESTTKHDVENCNRSGLFTLVVRIAEVGVF